METNTQVAEQAPEAPVVAPEGTQDEQAQAVQNLGRESMKLVAMPDGSFATKAEIDASRANNEEASGPYGGKARQ